MTCHTPPRRTTIVTTARAYLQMVAAARVLLEREPVWTERLLLKVVQALCGHHLPSNPGCARVTGRGFPFCGWGGKVDVQ